MYTQHPFKIQLLRVHQERPLALRQQTCSLIKTSTGIAAIRVVQHRSAAEVHEHQMVAYLH